MGDFARVAEDISRTTRKNEKVRILSDFLKKLSDDDLRIVCIFLTGSPFPLHDQRKLNVGGSTIKGALFEVTGCTEGLFRDALLKYGDLGCATEYLMKRNRLKLPTGTSYILPVGRRSLNLAEVHHTFERIAEAEGKGTQEVRERLVNFLLQNASPLEAKYLIKIFTSDLRLGLKENLVEEAIALAFDEDIDSVREANMLLSDIGEVAILTRGRQLNEASLNPFRPIKFMLAEAVQAPEEVFEIFSPTRGVFVEDKYDGIRVQAHKRGQEVRLYSRTLDDITISFPDVVDDFKEFMGDIILDGEIVAFDGRFLPFHWLQQRLRRKEPTPELIREVPVILFFFDLLYLNGENLLKEPLRKRMEILQSLSFAGKLTSAHRAIASNAQEVERYFREARNKGNEGLVIKDPDSSYQPGKRGKYWLKLKEELGILDVVVVAAEYGHGKRAGVLSDYTFAVKNGDSFKIVGKAYSGLTDQEIAELTGWFLENTIQDLGAMKIVKPEVLLEVAFDSIQRSTRHDSGFALRFPRIKRIRRDKTPSQINTLEDVKVLYETTHGS